MYRVDGVVRRSTPLQEACKHKSLVVRMHAKTAKELKLDQRNKLRFRMEKKSFCFPLLLDDKVSEGCIVIPAGLPEASALGGVSDWVEILV